MSNDRQASSLEFRPLRPAADRYDVAILGGGLAGLTLAIQLKQQRPDTSVVVLEKREGPAPEAAFKVGESTVPSGSHYFGQVIDMKDHLEADHLRKCGLRFFFTEGDNSDITKRFEKGPIFFPPHWDYQIDRGRFENELAARARSLGVDVLQGCRVEEVSFGEDVHSVGFTQAEADVSTQARWVVDAAGRASLLKRQLDLDKEVDHAINSAWLRLAGGLDIEQWGASDEAWMARLTEAGLRQFSTNHLMGEGYWVWLIPLGSGPISIGVCADPRFHPFEAISELDSLMNWLGEHEPQLAAAIEPRRNDVEDFLRVQDFAYGVDRVFSPERWCLVGEAAAFADPFFSPGSDMIAYGNMFSGDLISRDLDGEDIGERLEYWNDFYFRTFDWVLSKTENHYATFGDPRVLLPKLVFETVVNHSGTVFLAVKDKLTDLEFMKSVDSDIDKIYKLTIRVEQLFREWHALHEGQAQDVSGACGPIKAMIEMFFQIVQEYDDDGLREMVAAQVRKAEALAVAIFLRAASELPEAPDPERPINPYAVSLRPEAWEADGLFEEPGLTLKQATEVAEGIEGAWIDELQAAA
jgi:flavin-dependent dehydrogenase